MTRDTNRFASGFSRGFRMFSTQFSCSFVHVPMHENTCDSGNCMMGHAWRASLGSNVAQMFDVIVLDTGQNEIEFILSYQKRLFTISTDFEKVSKPFFQS